METIHDFLNRGVVVPPVDIQNIDVARLKFPETGFHADEH